MLETAIAGAASLAGGLLQNRQNRQEAEKARQFNAAEAAKNREFQRTMSNTAYQRAVGDMRAAGINPMLAYQKGGASSPGGSSASGPAASMSDVSSGAVNSALSARRLKKEISVADAQVADILERREGTRINNAWQQAQMEAMGILYDPRGGGYRYQEAGPQAGIWKTPLGQSRLAELQFSQHNANLLGTRLPGAHNQMRYDLNMGKYAPELRGMAGILGQFNPMAQAGQATAKGVGMMFNANRAASRGIPSLSYRPYASGARR